MSLKNNFKIGQASLEYFILFAMLALITILSLSKFHQDLKGGQQALLNSALVKMGLR